MIRQWKARLCVRVADRGIIGVRNHRFASPRWQLPGGYGDSRKDTDWMDTASLKTFWETGIRVQPEAIELILRFPLDNLIFYIGVADISKAHFDRMHKARQGRMESRLIDHTMFESMTDFDPDYKRIITRLVPFPGAALVA